jgi:hypothetical protein
MTLFSRGLTNLKFQDSGDLLLCTSNVFGEAPKDGPDLDFSYFSISTNPIFHVYDDTWYLDSAIWINRIFETSRGFRKLSRRSSGAAE